MKNNSILLAILFGVALFTMAGLNNPPGSGDFVDLTTAQTANGIKTWGSNAAFRSILIISNKFITSGSNFFNNSSPGTIATHAGGTNMYIKGTLKILGLDDGGGVGPDLPRVAVGVGLIGTGSDADGGMRSDITWAGLNNRTNGVDSAEGRFAGILGTLSGTNAFDRGGLLTFITKSDGSNGGGPIGRMTLDNSGMLIGLSGSGSLRLLTNWNANLISATISNVNATSVYQFNGVNGFTGLVTNKSNMSTNIEAWAGGIVTNVTRNP